MNIIYLLTILSIYILFMLIHKTEKKQNVITWLAISAILVLCYNTLICVACSFINILCTLQNLSICNTFLILILIGILLKNKKIQKYYLKISDVIVSAILLVIVLFVAYKQYGFPLNLRYKITDGSTHYYFAEQFFETSSLLYKGTGSSNIFGMYDSDFRLPGAYVNEGILFKLFNNILTKGELFVLFDLFILYLSGVLFYCLLQKYIKNRKMQIIAVVLSIMYMLGYQLNSMIYGYVYLSLVLDIILAFLILLISYDKREFDSNIILLILALLSFGVFFSYAYFIPIIYIAIIINLIIKSVVSKEKILSEENLIYIWCIIILPLILGLTYFIILPSAKGIENEISTIGAEGTIYKNYLTNYIVFIPIFIINVILAIKNKLKESNIGTILFVLSILFAIILLIGNKLGIVSQYYFFKSYYIIWPLVIYNAFLAICNILDSNKKALKIGTNIYISIYILVILISTLILKNNIGINNIFYDNVECIETLRISILNGELKVAEKTKDFNNTYTLAPKYTIRARWVSILNNNEFIYFDYVTKSRRTIEEWLKERDEKYYLAYYQDYNELETNQEYPNKNSDEYEIIFNNEYGFILERK